MEHTKITDNEVNEKRPVGRPRKYPPKPPKPPREKKEKQKEDPKPSGRPIKYHNDDERKKGHAERIARYRLEHKDEINEWRRLNRMMRKILD